MKEKANKLAPVVFALTIYCAPLFVLLMNPLIAVAEPPRSVTAKVDRQFREYDTDRNGVITPDEFPKAPLSRQADTDQDKHITRAELEAYYMDIYTKRHAE